MFTLCSPYVHSMFTLCPHYAQFTIVFHPMPTLCPPYNMPMTTLWSPYAHPWNAQNPCIIPETVIVGLTSNDMFRCSVSIAESTFWRNKVYVQQPGFFAEPRNISLFMCADGVNPHNDSTAVTSSITPISFQILNLPAEYRAKYQFLLAYGIIEGKSSNAQIYYKFLVDELLDMWHVGVRAFDSRKKEMFTLRCMLTCVVADYGTGGITEIANRLGSNAAAEACMFCNITGETSGTSCLNKTIFKGSPPYAHPIPTLCPPYNIPILSLRLRNQFSHRVLTL